MEKNNSSHSTSRICCSADSGNYAGRKCGRGGGADDIQPMSSDPNIFKAELKEDHSTISTSTTLDELEQMLDVQFFLNGQWTAINPENYSLTIDTPFLSEGSDTVSVVYNEWSYELEINGIISNDMTGIVVDHTELGDIFTSVTELQIKEGIAVTANFIDNTSVILNPDQYSISWIMSEWSEEDEMMTFIVEVKYDYGTTSTTFEYKMNALEVTGDFSAEWTNNTIFSYTSRSELASSYYFTVNAKFNDGQTRDLPYHDTYSGEQFDFAVSGTTLSEKDDVSFETTLDVYLVGNPNHHDSVVVTVNHVMPSELEVTYEGVWTYEAFTQVDPDALTVRLKYENGRVLTLDSFHYTITYSGVSDGGPQSFRVPESGQTASITVTVIEFGKPFPDTLSGFIVTPSEISRPDMDDNIQFNYSSEPYRWQIYNYDEDRMVVSIDSSGNAEAELVESEGNWYIQATDAGEYTVSISPIDQSVKWDSDPQDPVKFVLEIVGAEMIPVIIITGDTVYDPEGWGYNVSVNATGLGGAALIIGDDNVIYTYNGTKANGDTTNGRGLPKEAGIWTIYAEISGVENYQDTTVSESITISKKVLDKPELENYDYDGNAHSPSLISDSSIYSVSGDSKTNAGNHQATVTINTEHSNNYCWDASRPKDSNLDVSWTIKTASNNVESSNISGWIYVDDEDVDIKKILNEHIIVETVFETGYTIQLLNSNTNSVVSLSNGQYDAGTYYVKIIFDADVDEDKNGVPNFNGFEWTSTSTISVSPFKINLIPDAGFKNYQYDHQNESSKKQSSDITDTKYYEVLENKQYSEANEYPDAVRLKINKNYAWGDGQSGVQSDGTVVLAFTIKAVADNSVTMTWDGEGSSWEFGSTGNLPIPIAHSKYGPVTIYFWTNGSEKQIWNETNSPINAGDYSFQAVVEDSESNSYNGCSSSVEKFKISRQPVDIVPKYVGSLTYNGSEQTVTTDMLKGWDDNKYVITKSGSSLQATNHLIDGEYTIYIGLTSNYRWADGLDADGDGQESIGWNIDKRPIMLKTNLDGRSILISSGLDHPEYTVVDSEDVSLTFNLNISWSGSNKDPNSLHKGTLELSDSDFTNNYWVVNQGNNGSATDPNQQDLVDSKGKILWMWYTFILNEYEIFVNIDIEDTYTYNAKEFDLPDFSIEILDSSSMSSEDIESIENQFKSVNIYYTKDGSNETIAHPGSPIDVGTYVVHFVVPPTQNYGSASWTKEFQITEATIDISKLGDCTVDYTGTEILEHLENTLTQQIGVDSRDLEDIEWSFFESESGVVEYDFIDVIMGDNGPSARQVWYTVSAGDNYDDASGSFMVTVRPVTLTVILGEENTLSKIYDETVPNLTSLTYSADYKVENSNTLPVTFELEDQDAVNVGKYRILGTVESDNYIVQVKVEGSEGLEDANYSITKATLIDGGTSTPEVGAYVCYDIDTSEYNGKSRSFDVNVKGYTDSNNKFAIRVFINNVEDNSVLNAGPYSYRIIVTSSYAEDDEGNYNGFTVEGTFEIPKRQVSFDFTGPISIYYGESIPGGDVTDLVKLSSGSFASGESIELFGYNLSLSSDCSEESNVGSYTIKQKWTLNKGAADNYMITTVDGTLLVQKRPVVVTFVDGVNSSPYGMSSSDINNKINLEDAFRVTSGVEGLEPFANNHNFSEIFRLYINVDESISIPNVGEYGVLINYIDNAYSNNYSVTVRNSTTDNNATYHVYAATLSASLVTPDTVYDSEEKNISVRFLDSDGRPVEAPAGVSYHIEYYFNDSSELKDERYHPIIDAGKYDLRVKVDNTDNFIVNLTSAVITISPAAYFSYTLETSGDVYYNKTPQSLNVTSLIAFGYKDHSFDFTDTAVVKYYSDENRTIELVDPNDILNADTYYVRIIVDPSSTDTNYKSFSIDEEFVINKAPIIPTINTIYYDGADHNLKDLVAFSDAQLEYTVTLSNGGTSVQDADSYPVRISLADTEYNSNYKVADEYVEVDVTVNAIPIIIDLHDSYEYEFGGLSSKNLSDVGTTFDITVGPEYDGHLTKDQIGTLFNKEPYDFEATITAFTDIGGYVRAGTYVDSLGIVYSGNNFDISESDGADIHVGKATLNVTIPNISIQYNPDGMSFNSRIGYEGNTFDQPVNVNVVLKDEITLTHVGVYALSATVTDSANFDLNIIAQDPGEKNGVSAPYLEVTKASNYWTDMSAGIVDWDYKAHSSVDQLDITWPEPLNGIVVASIYSSSDDSLKYKLSEESIPTEVLTLPVGEYYVIFEAEASTVDGYVNYENIPSGGDGQPIYQSIRSDFEINQFGLSVEWSPNYVQYVDGESHEVVLQGLKDHPDATVYIGDIDSDFPHSVNESGQIVMSASELGTYGIYLTLDNPNYCWKESEGTTITVTWTIGHGEANSWDTQPSISSTWQYGEEPTDFTRGDAKYGDVTTLFYNRSSETLYGEDGTVIPTLPGQYYMRSFVVEADGTIQLDEWLEFSITKRTLPVPDVSDNLVFAYESGETIRFNTDLIANYSVLEPYTLLAGNEANEPGNYTLAISIADTTCCEWEGGDISPKFIQWTVAEGGILDKTMFVVDISEEVFTGHPIQKSIVSTNLVEGVDYIISYTDNESAGLATIVITGIGAYSGQVTYEFQINPANEQPEFYNEQLKMYVEDSSFYNALQMPSYIDESLLTYTSSDPSIATVDPHTGAITMNATGTVTITASYPGTTNYAAGSATYELTVSDTPVEVVDHVVYIRVPVTDPDDPDDPTDDKPEEPAIVYKNDNTLYIILLLVLAVICVCFAAYIMYTHRKQENQGGGQR